MNRHVKLATEFHVFLCGLVVVLGCNTNVGPRWDSVGEDLRGFESEYEEAEPVFPVAVYYVRDKIYTNSKKLFHELPVELRATDLATCGTYVKVDLYADKYSTPVLLMRLYDTQLGYPIGYHFELKGESPRTKDVTPDSVKDRRIYEIKGLGKIPYAEAASVLSSLPKFNDRFAKLVKFDREVVQNLNPVCAKLNSQRKAEDRRAPTIYIQQISLKGEEKYKVDVSQSGKDSYRGHGYNRQFEAWYRREAGQWVFDRVNFVEEYGATFGDPADVCYVAKTGLTTPPSKGKTKNCRYILLGGLRKTKPDAELFKDPCFAPLLKIDAIPSRTLPQCIVDRKTTGLERLVPTSDGRFRREPIKTNSQRMSETALQERRKKLEALERIWSAESDKFGNLESSIGRESKWHKRKSEELTRWERENEPQYADNARRHVQEAARKLGEMRSRLEDVTQKYNEAKTEYDQMIDFGETIPEFPY